MQEILDFIVKDLKLQLAEFLERTLGKIPLSIDFALCIIDYVVRFIVDLPGTGVVL